MAQGAEDPVQEHRFSQDYGYILLPWNERRPYRFRSQWHYPGLSAHICHIGEVFPSLFLYCFTLCIDASLCSQGLCMTIRGTDLDTYHQTIIPISSLSSLCLYKDYPPNHVQNAYRSVKTFQTNIPTIVFLCIYALQN